MENVVAGVIAVVVMDVLGKNTKMKIVSEYK